MSYFRKEDTRAAVWIAAIFALVIGGLSLWIGLRPTPEAARLTEAERHEAELLQNELRADSARRREAKNDNATSSELFPFDPNTADSTTLRRVGLSEYQTRNILKYRRRGGKWRSPNDFSRLYGLSHEAFLRLRPYIQIIRAEDQDHPFAAECPMPERPVFERVEKLREGAILSLNEVDTTRLKQIPGIGSYYARKIIQYRERLGGFVSTSQLAEIEGLPAGISRWFEVEIRPTPRRINLARATFKELVRHPYLNYEQTCAIVNHREKYGPISSWNDLSLYKAFTPADIERLKPYFIFK